MRELIKQVRGVALTATNLSPLISRLYHGTDKLEHGYLDHYRQHLRAVRMHRLTVFEIGVGGYNARVAGGSLPLWRDYFARSSIVGLDLHDKDIDFGPRVHFEQADQSRPEALLRVVAAHGRPDLVIDDGSHIGEHIVTSFQTLWPELRPGGWYVIEDLATSYAPDYGGGSPPPPVSGIGLVHSLIERVQSRDPALEPEADVDATGRARSDVAAVHVHPGIVFIAKAVRP